MSGGNKMLKLDELIEIKLRKRDLRPEGILARDLVDMLCQVEKAISAIAQNEKTSIIETDTSFALVSIKRGSAAYRLKPCYPDISIPAFETFAQAISSPESLPRTARISAENVSTFSSRYNTVIEFRSKATSKQPIGIVRPRKIHPIISPPEVVGETTLYGQVESIGGADPKAWVRLHSGQRIGFDINKTQAKTLGSKIYEEVGICGTAHWDSITKQIISFQLIEILPFKDTSVVEAFDILKNEFGSFFDELPDVTKFCEKQRRG